MKCYSAFYIYGIIYVAAVDIRFSKHEGNDQSVNLALDTIVEFDNKNNGEDIKFLDNVQKFIGKVKTVIVKKNLRRNFDDVNGKKLTDFILSLIQVLIKLEDSNLEDFFNIAAEEFKKYHYKGCKFYELIDNYDLRKFLTNKLDEMKHTPGDVMRHSLKALASKIQEENYNANEKKLIDYINSLYGQSSIELYNKVLGSLDDNVLKTKSDMILSKIISTGIRSIVFDYYTKLNRNARMALKTKINEFFERTMGISTYATKYVEENEKSFITIKKSTPKPNYVEQYIDLRNYAFSQSREKPLLSSGSINYNSKRVSNFYTIESPGHKIENKEKILIPSKTQKVSPKSKPKNVYKYFTQPYYEKETNRINYPMGYKHSKLNKKSKRQTYRTVHLIKASTMDRNDKSKSHKLKNIRKPSHVTPKEPEIKNSNVDSNEFISHDHEMTTSKRADDINTYEQVLKGKKELLKHKYHNNITSSRLLRGKPSSDSEADSKFDVEPTMNHNFDSQLKNYNKKLKTSYKLSKVYSTDNSIKDDKVVSGIIKIPDDRLRTVDELQINQSVDKKPNSQKNKDIILSKTTEPESIEIITFDDELGIEKGITVVQESAQKLPNNVKIQSTFERNIAEPSDTQRMKYNKLTFMTLYPEFVQKWRASGVHTKKQRSDSIDLKQTIRFGSRNTRTLHRKTKTTTNLSYNIQAKNIGTQTKTLSGQFEKPSSNGKAITKKGVIRPEISEAKLIRHLIVREKLKGFRHPLDKTSKINNKRRNDLSRDLFNSEDDISTKEVTEESETKTPYENTINNVRRNFLIDLNVDQSPPDGRRYDLNMKKYLKNKPRKLSKNINDISNEKLHKKLTSIKSNDTKDETDVYNYKKPPTINKLVLQKTQNLNYVEIDKNDFRKNIKGENLNITRYNKAGDKFKKYMDLKLNSDINKYEHNLPRKLFIDLRNAEMKNFGEVGKSNKRTNNFVKKNITRSNQNCISDVKKDTRRMINEQDIHTKTNDDSDKKVDCIQNYRYSFNEYTSTVRRKKIYFSYLNDGHKTDGYDLFYKQRMARASEDNSSIIKNLDNDYNSKYVPVTRENVNVTQFSESRKNDDNSFKDIFNIDTKNVVNKIVKQIENNMEINELNNYILKKDDRENSENKIITKEKDTKTFMIDVMNDPEMKSDKILKTGNFLRHTNENVDSLRTREEQIEITNRISIDDGKFRLEDNANKLEDSGQSLLSTKVTETNLKIQRRAPVNSNVKETTINTPDFIGRQEAMESNMKSSALHFKPIAVTITTDKIATSTLNVDAEQSTTLQINDINNSISSAPTVKNTFTNNQNGDKTNEFNYVTDANYLRSNKKNITDMPEIGDYSKPTNTTLSYFNVTSDIVRKLI